MFSPDTLYGYLGWAFHRKRSLKFLLTTTKFRSFMGQWEPGVSVAEAVALKRGRGNELQG